MKRFFGLLAIGVLSGTVSGASERKLLCETRNGGLYEASYKVDASKARDARSSGGSFETEIIAKYSQHPLAAEILFPVKCRYHGISQVGFLVKCMDEDGQNGDIGAMIEIDTGDRPEPLHNVTVFDRSAFARSAEGGRALSPRMLLCGDPDSL